MSRLKQTIRDPLVVLVVDDDKVYRERLCRAFRDRDCEAHESYTAAETIDLARNASPDLVLLDLKMSGLNGLDLIQDIKKLDGTIAVIILTGYGSIATAMQALKLGADHYLSKPADAEQILDAYADLGRDPNRKHTPTTVPSLAIASASGVGAYSARPFRLLRQHFTSGKAAWHPSPLSTT